MIYNGIDTLKCSPGILERKRLGLITNPTGVDFRLDSDIDWLSENYRLLRLFAPEHGIRGDIQAGGVVADTTDAGTGIEVQSAYGRGELKLSDLDCLLYDIQDVGLRFYTYIYVMADAMKACAKQGIPFIVLDRINPLGLTDMEGTVLPTEGFNSGVGQYALPTRYALTVGELARYLNAEFSIGCDLTVIPCTGLNRRDRFPDSGQLWIQPSPNLPTYQSTVCYAGTCIFEGTNLSEGRGTTKPFELIGAPWLDHDRIAADMNAMELPGVRFRPACFTPCFSKYSGEMCRGVQLHVSDPTVFSAERTARLLLEKIRVRHGNQLVFHRSGERYFIDLLTGNPAVREGHYTEVEETADAERRAAFTERARPYFLY